MNILITGGTGFLGRHLVWRLAAENCRVIFTGRDPQAAALVKQYSPKPVEWLPLTHGAPETSGRLRAATHGTDAIIHSAALSAPWGNSHAFQQANVVSTGEILETCTANNIRRLVHISTPSLYFDFRDRFNIREDSPLPAPVNEYARTKSKAETLIQAYPAPETVILRPRALFGPWDNTLLPRLIRVMEQGTVPLIRDGRAMLDLTYIDNAVDAIWLALTSSLPRPVNTYNVSNGEPIMLKTLLEHISATFQLPLRTRKLSWGLAHFIAHQLERWGQFSGKEPLMTRYTAGTLSFSQTLDLNSIRSELGYQPRITLREGIRRHAEWWKKTLTHQITQKQAA